MLLQEFVNENKASFALNSILHFPTTLPKSEIGSNPVVGMTLTPSLTGRNTKPNLAGCQVSHRTGLQWTEQMLAGDNRYTCD